VEKDNNYAAMAQAIDMEFIPFVLYTYGGFHSSALKVIQKMAESLDPACCLLSHTEWKRMLMQHIAIAVQRGNADIMIQASQRSREAQLGRPVHRRRPLRSRSSESETSPRAASGVSAGTLPPLRATERGVDGSAGGLCEHTDSETALPAHVIATALVAPVVIPVDTAACDVRAGSNASTPFIVQRDVSNSVSSDAATVVLEWCESPCESPCASISRAADIDDTVVDSGADPPLSPSLCLAEFDSESGSETLSALMEDDCADSAVPL
jgi:hypothetical protein